MILLRKLSSVGLILVILAGLSASASLQSGQSRRFFEATGHWVEGEFLDFYDQVPDPLALLGYPITEAIPHPVSKTTIQYFQRARLELDEDAPEGQRVKIAPLGDWLFGDQVRGAPAPFSVNSGACRTFQTTGKAICYAFLNFYDTHNGPFYFGDPISDVEVVDGRLVQYFNNARMEWRPEMPVGKRVVLTDLGRMDFDLTVGNVIFTFPADDIPLITPLALKVHAFADRPVLASGETQVIYVVVQDQQSRPVQDAQVSISLRLPDGDQQNLAPSGPTNADGFTQVRFSLEQLQPNQVIEVHVTANLLNGPENSAISWFRSWW